MSESITKSSFMVFAAKLISWFFLFLNGVLIARTFGPKGVGTYDLFMSIINFSIMLGSLSIGTATIYLMNKKKESASQLFSNVVAWGIGWGIVLALATFVLFFRVLPLPVGFSHAYVFGAVLTIPFVLLQNYLLPFFLAKFKMLQWSFFSIIPAACIAAGTALLIFVLRQPFANALSVVPLSNAVLSLALLLVVMRMTGAHARFKVDLFMREVKIGLASYVGDVFQAVNFRLNLFFVSAFLPIAQVGYYSLALNVGNILFLVPYAFQQVLYSAWSLRSGEDVDRDTPAIARQTFLVGAGAAFLLFVAAKYVVVHLLYGRVFLPSLAPLVFLLPGIVCMVFASTFFNNFFSKGKAYLTTFILLFTFFLNIVLNIFLIPRFGMQGAAISASVSYCVSALLALSTFSVVSKYSVFSILQFASSDFSNIAFQFLRLLGFEVFSGKRNAIENGRIKVCHVSSADVSLRFLVFSQMQYLKTSGFEVYAVSSPGKWVKDIEKAGIRHKAIRITRKVFTPLADVTALVRLYLFFRKEKFTIVHTHTLKASFLGQIAAFLAGVPVRMYTIHGLDFLNTSFPPLARKIFLLIDRIIARLVHCAFTVNKEAVQIAQDIGMYPPDKIVYLGVSLDTEKFNPARFSQEFILAKKRELGIPLQAKVVGMVARLVKEKGFRELFQAWSKVIKEFPEALVVVVGGTEPEKKDSFDSRIVKEYGIEKSVLFLGERRDVDELNAVFDVLVLPSYREGLGITLLEASAMEKPVIASDISGCREAVDHNKTGILVPPKDAEKLAQAILYLLSNPKIAEQMGKAGRKKVEQEFTERISFERLRAAYDRLLKEKLKN